MRGEYTRRDSNPQPSVPKTDGLYADDLIHRRFTFSNSHHRSKVAYGFEGGKFTQSPHDTQATVNDEANDSRPGQSGTRNALPGPACCTSNLEDSQASAGRAADARHRITGRNQARDHRQVHGLASGPKLRDAKEIVVGTSQDLLVLLRRGIHGGQSVRLSQAARLVAAIAGTRRRFDLPERSSLVDARGDFALVLPQGRGVVVVAVAQTLCTRSDHVLHRSASERDSGLDLQGLRFERTFISDSTEREETTQDRREPSQGAAHERTHIDLIRLAAQVGKQMGLPRNDEIGPVVGWNPRSETARFTESRREESRSEASQLPQVETFSYHAIDRVGCQRAGHAEDRRTYPQGHHRRLSWVRHGHHSRPSRQNQFGYRNPQSVASSPAYTGNSIRQSVLTY